jgi:hypothetical protein
MDKEQKKQIEQAEKALEEFRRSAEKTGCSSIIHTNAGIFQRGDVFEAQAVKGHTNYVIFMMVKDGWAFYCHGDKAKKVQESHFQKLIDYGDLVPIPRENRDPERMSLAVLGLMAMDNGLAFNDYMKVLYGQGHGSQADEMVKY